MCAYFVAAEMQLESVWGLSASSEAARGGQVGGGRDDGTAPLPAACLVSAVTHSLNPGPTSTLVLPCILYLSLLLICLLWVYD